MENVGSPLMVFIHGGGVSGWMWDKQVDFFKEYHILVEILSIKPQIIDYAIINSALTRPMKLTNVLIKPTMKMSYGLMKNDILPNDIESIHI